jgi:hypothetical protein
MVGYTAKSHIYGEVSSPDTVSGTDRRVRLEKTADSAGCILEQVTSRYLVVSLS